MDQTTLERIFSDYIFRSISIPFMMKLKKNIAISENGFLFNPETGDSFIMNPVAREIMNYFKAHLDVSEIRQLILERYEVDVLTLEKNLEDFVEMLQYHELVEK